MEFKEKVELIQVRMKFDIEEFMKLYRADVTREGMMADLGLSMYSVVKILAELKLPTPKGKRKKGYEDFYAKLHDVPEGWDPSEEMREENTYLQHKLGVAERAIQRARDENNHLRGNIRKDTRADSLEERILNLVEGALPIKRSGDITVIKNKAQKKYKDYVSNIILSDIHAEELVTSADVGNLNPYNWEIMTQRINHHFGEWLKGYRGEDRGIVSILGDVISGVIHSTLESTTKPTALAVNDLADLLAERILEASYIYKELEVFSLGGNHERLNAVGGIKSANKGYDFGYLFAQILKAKLSSRSNIIMHVSTNGHLSTKVGTQVIAYHHGDLYRSSGEARDNRVLHGFKSILGVNANVVIQGHVHKFQMYNVNVDTVYICNASVIGSNSYGVTNGFLALRPSQTLIMYEPDGTIEYVRQIFLDKI